MELTGIAVFYILCLGTGFLLALVGAFFGELSSHGIDFGHGTHFEHGGTIGHEANVGGHEIAGAPHSDMPGASFFNMITICTFVAFFGLTGLVAVWGLHMGALVSLFFSFPVAFILAVLEFMAYVKVFVKAQASSEATMSDILGCEGTVIASIPADRLGQITYTIKGSRYTAPACSADGEDIPRGSRVRVVNFKGAVLVVRLV